MARGEAERAAVLSSPSIVSMAKLSLATKRIACHWPSLRPEPGGETDEPVSENGEFQRCFKPLQASEHFQITFASEQKKNIHNNHNLEPTTSTDLVVF